MRRRRRPAWRALRTRRSRNAAEAVPLCGLPPALERARAAQNLAFASVLLAASCGFPTSSQAEKFTRNGFSVKILLPARVDKESFLGRGTNGRQLGGPGISVSGGSNGAPNIAHRRPGGLDGLYHQQTEGNEHKLGSCLVEFFSRPPSAGRRLRFRRLWMKAGLELI